MLARMGSFDAAWAQKKVAFWVFVPLLVVVGLWLAVSAWRVRRECDDSCRARGLGSGDFMAGTRTREPGCRCAGAP